MKLGGWESFAWAFGAGEAGYLAIASICQPELMPTLLLVCYTGVSNTCKT